MKDNIRSMQLSQKEKFGKLLDKLNDIAAAKIRNSIEGTLNKLK